MVGDTMDDANLRCLPMEVIKCDPMKLNLFIISKYSNVKQISFCLTYFTIRNVS